MNTIPIAFAFDNNLVMPACICLSSLMMNAQPDTFYDIFILHSEKEDLRKEELNKLPTHYPNCRIQYRTVDDSFDRAFEIRGITIATYYRLLIPELIPEYEKILYSDVDVIFRSDLSKFYDIDLTHHYLAGVNSLAHLIPDNNHYYTQERCLDASQIIYAGNIVMNAHALRADGIIEQFKQHIQYKYRFQDMDIINIVCANHIKYLSPDYCVTNYFCELAARNRQVLYPQWDEVEIDEALFTGIVHYNGQKPWKGLCPNFDIWWEYYRKSPYFDEKFYFEFFYSKLNELDQLSLWKRIKILARYFIHGKQ